MFNLIELPEVQALKALSADGRVLFSTRMVRLFAYGFLSVVLALYLKEVGLAEQQIGLLLTWTLVGDAVISLWITTVADRLGRKRMLIVGAGLMVFAGIVFALTTNITLLTIAAIIGTISPSGNEVGPCFSIEQAALPQTAPDKHRTQIFAWYSLIGSLATAFGSLIGGVLAAVLQRAGVSPLDSYRVIVVGYALLGTLLAVLFLRLSPAAETQPIPVDESIKRRFGLHRSQGIVAKLSALFMVDAFAGGLVVQSLVAYWFNLKFGVDPALLGVIFFGANLFAGLSALAAARVAARIGLVNAMVWTHIPSNVLLILVPLMPNLPLAILVLLARFSISQMDVPTRQSYVMAVVAPDERSAAAGITSIARTLATSFSPYITGLFLAAGGPWLSAPFFVSGGLKIIYDLVLYRNFQAVRPPEEQPAKQG